MSIGPGRQRDREALGGEGGAAAVEFALVLTILILLLFGILEFGRVNAQIEIFEGAAREGARRAAVGHSYNDIVAAVQAHSDPFPPDEPISVAVSGTTDTTCGESGLTVGRQVTVSWSQSFDVTIPLWNEVTVNRNIKGVFRCEK
jgi:Flp pilus assembly protein TadG